MVRPVVVVAMPSTAAMVAAAVTAAIGWIVKTTLDRLTAYIQDSTTWRRGLDERMDTLMGATQTTMRATLIHNAEKYMERGWLTPEERASWADTHDRYSALGANGLIGGYRQRLDALPDKEI